MLPDSPQTPGSHDEDPPSRVFDETRPSTLAKPTTEPPSSATEAPASATETSAFIAPALLEEFAASQNPTAEPGAPVTVEATAPTVSFETANPALALAFAPAPDAPFQSSVTVGIACQTPGARVFYTLDGTAPDQSSAAYDKDKILLTQSAMLSARAFDGGQSGPVKSADYVVSKPMWQENEPADQTDPTPHKIGDNLGAPDGWNCAAASVRGKLHAHRALWREDAFALGSAGNWSIAIVSDGAGSAPLSRVGSNIACQTALGDLTKTLGAIETLGDDINAELPRIKAALVGAAQSALQAIRDEAAARNQPANAFAATLLVLVRRAHDDKQLCAAIQVGDGAIALDCASGLKLLGAADHGQHSSETRFLTTQGMDADFNNRVKFSLPADLRATLVVSDGVSDDYFPEDQRLVEVFDAVKPLAQNADDAGAALLQWLGYEKKGSSDDRTIALSWPASPGAAATLEAELGEAAPQLAPTESTTETADSATADSKTDMANSETDMADSATGTADSETDMADSAMGTASPAVSDAGALGSLEMRDGS